VTANRIIRNTTYFIIGVIEFLLAFRLVFKILGANSGGTFVSLIYSISGVFLASFNGIFGTTVNNGIETKPVLEPATIIAMIVYALIAFGVLMLIKIFKTPNGNMKFHNKQGVSNSSVVTKIETTTVNTQVLDATSKENKVN
jgi:hypothetical protein